MQIAASGAAAAGLAPLVGAAPASARSNAGNIKMWWWGQQEAVGIQSWMDDTIKKFKTADRRERLADADGHRAGDPAVHEGRGGRQRPRRAVPVQRDLPHGERLARLPQAARRPRLRRHDQVNGGGTKLSQYAGQARTARASTPSAFGVQYNKEHFDKAGLNADSPPKTWDAFLNAATSSSRRATSRSAAASRTASSASGGCQLADPEPQQRGRRAQPLHRQARLARPEVPRALVKLAGAARQTVLQRRRHVARASTRASSCTTPARRRWLSTTRRRCPNSQKKLGKDVVGFMKCRRSARARWLAYPIIDTQGFGIPAKAKDPETRGEVHRLHALAGAAAGDTGRCRSRSRPTRASTPSVINDPLIKRRLRQVDRRPSTTSTSPT